MLSVNRRTCGWLCVAAGAMVAGAIGLWLNTASGDEPRPNNALRAAVGQEETAVLEEHVATLAQLHRKLEALNEVGAKGGEMEKLSLAATALNVARADLAVARGDVRAAIGLMERAYSHAKDCVDSSTATYEAGMLVTSDLVSAIELRKNCALKLLALNRQASAQ